MIAWLVFGAVAAWLIVGAWVWGYRRAWNLRHRHVLRLHDTIEVEIGGRSRMIGVVGSYSVDMGFDGPTRATLALVSPPLEIGPHA